MALFDIISTHEITVNIIQYLITIYITMIRAGTDFDGNHTSWQKEQITKADVSNV
jgi:hypothetical protein